MVFWKVLVGSGVYITRFQLTSAPREFVPPSRARPSWSLLSGAVRSVVQRVGHTCFRSASDLAQKGVQ